MKKRMIALLIAVLMLAALLPAAALAETPRTCPNCGKGYGEGWTTTSSAEQHSYKCVTAQGGCGFEEVKHHNHAAACESCGQYTSCVREYTLIEGTNTHINKCVASADGACLHGYGGEGKVETCRFDSRDDIYCYMAGYDLICACGRTYEPNPDNHDTYTEQAPDGHYEKCRYCPYESQLEPHHFVNNECDVCYYRQLILIETIEIGGLTPPVVGEMPELTAWSLTRGVGVNGIYWFRYDAEEGMTGLYADNTMIESVPFRAGENYVIGIELFADCGYYFDPAKTKIVYNGKEIPLFDSMENALWPDTCATIDDDETAAAFINMADMVTDDYATEKFFLRGYELGKSALETSVFETYRDFRVAQDGTYYAILLEKDGLPDIAGNGYNGPFEANTPYWLAIGVEQEMQPCMLAPADDSGDETNPLAQLSDEELENLRDWAKEFDLNVAYNDALLLPYEGAAYGEPSAFLFFRLVPLQGAVAPTGHEHGFFCWNTDEQGHWPVCYCGITIGLKDEHVFGEDNICDVCGYVMPVVQPVVPELPQTGDASRTALYIAAAGMAAILLCALLRKRA